MPYDAEGRSDEISLLDILLILARHKKLIVRTILVCALVGLTYSLLAPEEYGSEAKMVREAEGKGPELSGGGLGGLAGVAAGSAISGLLGGGGSGLGVEAFPDVLKGRAVRLAVVRDTFRFPDADRPMTFVQYANRPPGVLGKILNYTIKLPWTLKEDLSSLAGRRPLPAGTTDAGVPMIPSEEEDKALKEILEMVSTSVAEETGLMTVTVRAGSPRLAAALTESFLDHFTARVREIRTKKVRDRLRFVEGRYEEAEQELAAAEDRLAQFLEQNQNPTTATLEFRRDRLRRQVNFKEQLYSQLQSQVTQTRLDLRRQQPVITIVEPPVPPIERDAPKRTLILVVSVVLGMGLGVIVAFLSEFLFSGNEDSREREKLDELIEAARQGTLL
jgi:uncharacterized protein involved in exopolysaccharide biosynthesis